MAATDQTPENHNPLPRRSHPYMVRETMARALALAMLAHVPFALTENLETGRVDGQMHRPTPRSTRQARHVEPGRAARIGRIMRYRDRQPEQGLEAGQETLRLAQRQLENRTQAQCTQDRRVTVAFACWHRGYRRSPASRKAPRHRSRA